MPIRFIERITYQAFAALMALGISLGAGLVFAPMGAWSQERDENASENSPKPSLQDVYLDGYLGADGPLVRYDVRWQVFSARVGSDEQLQLVASTTGPSAHFRLVKGQYIVHATYGQVHATRHVVVADKAQRLRMIFVAGALSLRAVVGQDQSIADNQVRYALFSLLPDGDRLALQQDAQQNKAVPLAPGTYHVISTYGDANAIVRFDVTIKPGQLTQTTVRHKAAQVTMRLMRNSGGEALANTNWTVLTPGGDVVREATGAYLTTVLAEGEYNVVAEHGGDDYTRTFSVKNGEPRTVDIVME